MSVRAPRKYLDKDKTQVNPAWLEWREAKTHAEIKHLGPGSYNAYFPPEDKELPDEGAWIRVLEEPHTELRWRFRVPVLSMWRARRTEMNTAAIGGYRPQLATILTPGGELSLWPHEYTIVPDITEYVGLDPDVTMHTLGGDPLFSVEQEEQLFYLQSRGISRRDAALLLLNDLQTQGFCYFTMHEAYVEMFAGVGVPLWRHMALSPRADHKAFSVKVNVSPDLAESR